jgi:hypothetical protein
VKEASAGLLDGRGLGASTRHEAVQRRGDSCRLHDFKAHGVPAALRAERLRQQGAEESAARARRAFGREKGGGGAVLRMSPWMHRSDYGVLRDRRWLWSVHRVVEQRGSLWDSVIDRSPGQSRFATRRRRTFHARTLRCSATQPQRNRTHAHAHAKQHSHVTYGCRRGAGTRPSRASSHMYTTPAQPPSQCRHRPLWPQRRTRTRTRTRLSAHIDLYHIDLCATKPRPDTRLSWRSQC